MVRVLFICLLSVCCQISSLSAQNSLTKSLNSDDKTAIAHSIALEQQKAAMESLLHWQIIEIFNQESQTWENGERYHNVFSGSSSLPDELIVDSFKLGYWKPYTKSKIEYRNELKDIETLSNWDGSGYRTFTRELYHYLPDNRLSHFYTEALNPNNNEWVQYIIDTFEYNQQGQRIASSSRQLGADNAYYLVSEDSFIYDNDGDLAVSYNTSYLASFDDYIYLERTYIYNPGKELVEVKTKTAADPNGTYDTDLLSETYSYNSDKQLVTLLTEAFHEDDGWINALRISFYYDATTSIQPFEPIATTFFPNPANDLITIESSEFKSPFVLKILDSKGQLAAQKTIQSARMPINISPLSNGTYYLQIEHSNKVHPLVILR